MRAWESPGRYAGQAAFAGVALAVAAATALLAAGGGWALRELTGRASLYASYRELQRNAGRADSLSAAFAAVDRDLASLAAALPADNRSSHVVNLLVAEARSRGLGIGGITALDEVPFPGYAELPFEVDLSGPFPELVRYLHSLETQGMAVRLRRMSARNEGLNKPRVQARLEVSVYAPAGGTAGASGPAASAERGGP